MTAVPPPNMTDDEAIRRYYRERHGCTCRPEIHRLEDLDGTVVYLDLHHQPWCAKDDASRQAPLARPPVFPPPT